MKNRQILHRMCINCRIKKEKHFLYKIVLSTSKLVFDSQQKLPGRAAYLCGSVCIEKVHPGRFIKAFQLLDFKTKKLKEISIDSASWEPCKQLLLQVV